MLRLVITIVVALYLAISLAIFVGDKIEMALFYEDGEPFYAGQYGGAFDLLDEAIAVNESRGMPEVLRELRAQFRSPLRLHYKHELDLPSGAWDIVDSGAIYLHDLGDSTYLYRLSIYPDRIWSITVVPSSLDERLFTMNGPLRLIQTKLSGTTNTSRALVIEELSRSYNVPLSLKNIAESGLSDADRLLLEGDRIVVKTPMRSGELFFMRLDESTDVIQFGPIDYPARFENENWYYPALIAAMVILCIVLWIWPLWRDLQRLRSASLDIGSGKLNTRVRSHRASFIRPILDSFNSMAARTENMVESQRELTNAVSHELRTPLARMMFDLQMARDTEDLTEQSRHFDNLVYNVGELSFLVDELLTYARQEGVESPLQLESLSVEQMKHWLTQQVSRALRGAEKTCQIDVDFYTESSREQYLQFSPQLMAHALSNVLQNAQRFGKEFVLVQFYEEDSEWVLGVEDDGMGISHDLRDRAFEPFSRLDESRQRGSGGFGLGLSIVRKIAQWHQGTARIVTCTTLSGARVEIRWPIHPG